MKKDNLMMVLLLAVSTYINAQDYYQQNYSSNNRIEAVPTSCVTVGILQGGGSLIGADLEFLLSERIGAQVGGGLVGFGGGLNFHLKPGIRSSFISLQYWNQGIGETFVQSLVGPNYVYRSKKWFTFQVGLGAILEIGDETIYEDGRVPDVILTYAIGAYFPW